MSLWIFLKVAFIQISLRLSKEEGDEWESED